MWWVKYGLRDSGLVRSVPLMPRSRFYTCVCRFLKILFQPKFVINVTTLIFKLSISHFLMVVFLALHPVKSVLLVSFFLLERLAKLLTGIAIDCWLGHFLNKAVSFIDFMGPFQTFKDYTVVWCLGSRFDLSLSCARTVGPGFCVDLVCEVKKIVGYSVFFFCAVRWGSFPLWKDWL